jgi:hypothetical protein
MRRSSGDLARSASIFCRFGDTDLLRDFDLDEYELDSLPDDVLQLRYRFRLPWYRGRCWPPPSSEARDTDRDNVRRRSYWDREELRELWRRDEVRDLVRVRRS